MGSNGWRSGNDPTVRALRAMAAVVFIISIPLMLILDRVDAGFALAVIMGVLLLLGVVEGVVRLPDWIAPKEQPSDDDD